MQHEKQFYIDGKWVDPIEPAFLDVIDPSTEEAFTQIAVGSAADVDRAVAAARMAFPGFARTTVKERLELLRAILAEYNKRRNDAGDAIDGTGPADAVVMLGPWGTPAKIGIASSPTTSICTSVARLVARKLISRAPCGAQSPHA